MADDRMRRIGRELLVSSFMGSAISGDESWMLERMATSLEEYVVSAGEVLYREGDPADYVYLMAEGRARMSREGHSDWIYEGRWVIGTVDVQVGRPRARTATVEQDARLFRYPGDLWNDVLEDSFEITVNALTGSATGTAALYARIAPKPAFPEPEDTPVLYDTSTLVGRALLLSEVPLLRGAGVQALTDLAETTVIQPLAAGDALFAPRTRRGHVHVVVRGAVEVHRDEPRVTGRFGPGAVVGSAVCLASDDAWGARALSPSEVLSFSVEEWFNQMEEHPEMARVAMTALALERERLMERMANELDEMVFR